MKHTQTAMSRNLWHTVHAAETSCLLLEQLGIRLTSNSMPACAILGQAVAEDVRGHALPGGHYCAEEAPDETLNALLEFFGGE